MATQAAPLISVLFKDLQSYLTNKDLKIEDSTKKFFQKFYNVLYQNYISSYKKPLPDGFSRCLMDKIHLIKPFGKVSQEITAMLQKDLLPVQVFLRGLRTAEQVLDVAKNPQLSEKCSDALVKMSYCSLCDGFKDLKPCMDYCSEVVSRCLNPYTRIQFYWSLYITAMDELSAVLSKSLDASVLFRELRKKISESMLYADQSPRKVR